MCGDVSRWAVPSVSLCACRVCEWSVCLQNIISRFSLRLALALSNAHTRHTHKEATACPHRSPLTRKEAAAWPACPHRSALTRSHTADTSRISSLGLAPPLSIRTRQTHKEAAACPHRSPLTHSRSFSTFHFTHTSTACAFR